MAKLFIPVILGTVRKGRFSEHAAKLLHEELSQREGVETEIVDIRDLSLDYSNEGEDIKNPDFADKMQRADGYAIVTPEYNRSFPGSLKHALDTNYKEYRYKAVGVCGVSSGKAGGARAINALLPILKIYGMYAIRPEVYFASIQDAYTEAGETKDAELIAGYQKQSVGFLDELVAVSEAMKELRTKMK